MLNLNRMLPTIGRSPFMGQQPAPVTTTTTTVTTQPPAAPAPAAPYVPPPLPAEDEPAPGASTIGILLALGLVGFAATEATGVTNVLGLRKKANSRK